MLVKNDTTGMYYWHGDNITESEYIRIRDMIYSKPYAPAGYEYRLKDNFEWELHELPVEPTEIVDEDAEATDEDYLEALAEMGVQA